MAEVTVAEGDSSSVPDITLDPGTYRLTLNLPTEPPDWITGVLYNGLRVLGLNVQAVDKSGQILVLTFVV